MQDFNYGKFPDYTSYSWNQAGFSFGNPMLDFTVAALMQNRMVPRPAPGTTQSIYDAYQMRERNMQFLQARNSAFANNLLFQRLGGVNQNTATFQIMSSLASDPDGAAMRFLSPLIG